MWPAVPSYVVALLSVARLPLLDQSIDPTQVQLLKVASNLAFAYRRVAKGTMLAPQRQQVVCECLRAALDLVEETILRPVRQPAAVAGILKLAKLAQRPPPPATTVATAQLATTAAAPES